MYPTHETLNSTNSGMFEPYNQKEAIKDVDLEKQRFAMTHPWPRHVNMEINGKIVKHIPYEDAKEWGYEDFYDMEPIETHDSVWHTCFNCNTYQQTWVLHFWGVCPWLLCIIMFLTGFWLCCICPLFVNGFKTSNHYCKHCNQLLAQWTPL